METIKATQLATEVAAAAGVTRAAAFDAILATAAELEITGRAYTQNEAANLLELVTHDFTTGNAATITRTPANR